MYGQNVSEESEMRKGVGDVGYMSGAPRSGAQRHLATEGTEITEAGGQVLMLCALRALRWLDLNLGVPSK
jgi:hypothetical protein